ncbi:MAG: alpha/beta hydrolase [Gammaproteobacteria bacterium]|nr:alpha/beta hydrolase [Gammaproteobacteria bacterium]
MKFKEIMHDLSQIAGLKVMNTIARSGEYVLQESCYGAHERHRYDCYLHKEANASRPKIIFIYGGNWRSGGRRDYRFVADSFCSLGFDVFIPDYRLFPEVRFGQILDDIRLAVDEIMSSITLGPIFLVGHSAGAQLAALLTLNARLLRSTQRIAGFVGLAGPYDFFPYTEDSHWELFAPAEKYPESQPVNFVRSDAAPLYLLHGKDDKRVRRGHSKSLMEKQQAVGGMARREVYDGMGHIDIVASLSRIYPGKSEVLRDINRFVTVEAMKRV